LRLIIPVSALEFLYMKRKEENMFSETLTELLYCYQRMNFPLQTVCSPAGTEYESLRRTQLIQLCAKIAKEYGAEVEGLPDIGVAI